MHDAQVVDDEEVARRELELDPVLRRLEHPAEALVRLVVAADSVGSQAEGLCRARVVAHRLDVPPGVERDDRRLGLELSLGVGVAEPDRRRGQQLEIIPRQIGRDAEGVDERVLSAVGARGEAVQQLERGRRVAIRIVGVRTQAEAGVREVRRVDDRLHVEQAPVVRLADEAEELRDTRHRSRFGRPAGENREAELVDGREPVAQCGAARRDVVVARDRQGTLEPRVPERARPRGRLAGIRAQPVLVEAAHVPVGERDRAALDLDDREIVRQRPRVEEALSALVATLAAGTVVAQPERVEAVARDRRRPVVRRHAHTLKSRP